MKIPSKQRNQLCAKGLIQSYIELIKKKIVIAIGKLKSDIKIFN